MSTSPPARRRRLRWALPLSAAVALGLITTGVVAATQSSPTLPARSAAQLLQALHTSHDHPLSGVVVANVDLDNDQVATLLTKRVRGPMPQVLNGSHTLQLWFSGTTEQRVAVLDGNNEVDTFRQDGVLWQCTNGTESVVRTELDHGGVPPLTALALTPPALADGMLSAMDAGTTTSVAGAERVAGRDAYQLVLTPADGATVIGSVHIAVDSKTGAPLRVQAYRVGDDDPQLDVAYSSVSLQAPPTRYVTYEPTPSTGESGRTVTSTPQPTDSDLEGAASPAEADGGFDGSEDGLIPVSTSGVGWSAVTQYELVGGKPAVAEQARELGAHEVRGAWGRGHLVESPLLTVLVTDAGRVFAGSVPPSSLYRAVSTAR